MSVHRRRVSDVGGRGSVTSLEGSRPTATRRPARSRAATSRSATPASRSTRRHCEQKPLLQICPWFEQFLQAWPFLPQNWSLVAPNWVHTPAEQQLDGHVWALQGGGPHALFVHTWEAVVQFVHA